MHGINNGDDVVQGEASSMSLFQGSSNVNIQNTDIKQIQGNFTHIQNITTICFGDDQFTHDERNLISDIISTHVPLPHIHNSNLLTQLIINLPRAEAVFDDYRNKKKSGACFEGTRVALLREMADWVTDKDGSRMYILSGLAGIGKSTVAFTIASRAAKLNLLGASFFFSRDEQDRNNAKKLFTTIAYQLCVYNEAFAKAIGDALQTEHGSAATTKDIREQLQVLILDPLRNIGQSRTRPTLIVIDALDECDEDDEYAVIMGLSQLVRGLPSFKVILTTRPKPCLDRFSHNQHKLFCLHDIEDKVVDSDIRLYLKHSLSLEQVRERCLRWQWCANDKEIDTLVHVAGRLFIVASTAVRYILDKIASNPAAQMHKLLHAFAEDCAPFKDLDHFYTIIIGNVVPANCDDDDIINRYQSVVGAIIFIHRPLTISALSHLIHINEDEIRAVLERLQSVILLGNDDVPRIYHKSFPDYLTDKARCKDAHLRIDSLASHTLIAMSCFQITNELLKYNILGLSKIARYMSNEGGLKEDGITDEQIQEKIPQQLHYACVHWANHFQVATIENPDLMNGFSKFVNEHTLHWFEVLSLIGNLDSAHRTLLLVLKILDSPSNLQQLLSDALRFVLKFYEIIEHSALHTYYSALPFSPTDSLLYQQFIKEAEDKIFVIEGGPKKWDALVASPIHGPKIDFIKYSHDSALFCSHHEEYEGYGELKIWNAATGTPISTIPGQMFAVSHDFSTIVSSEADTITYYDTNGSERGTMLTTPSKILKLAISSDSSRVAAVLFDGSISLWEAKDAELIGIFDEFKNTRSSIRLQFSSTGTRLVYSPLESCVIRLRDGKSGRFIADLPCGPNHMFAFSDNGSRIASMSSEHDLTLWSSESGALISGNKNGCWEHLAISENGSLLATADQNGVVTLWSENCGHLVQIEVFRQSRYPNSLFSMPFSMAFAMDNILAIGSINDIKLYDVKTHSLISTLPFGGFSQTLAFSPDCTRFAYGADGQMYLWDIQGINSSGPLSNAAAVVTAIALSRDCSRLVCGYEDGRVELWGTRPTSPAMRRIASHKAHMVSVMAFGPDNRLFASASSDGTIKLWNGGDGSLHGALQAPSELSAVALSNSMLVAAGEDDASLWSLDTLSFIHAFQNSHRSYSPTVSISDENDFAAVGYEASVDLIDVVNCAIIATFTVPALPYKLEFLPDKSHLVVQLLTGAFVSFNVINHCITKGSIFEHLIQLPDTPLWHGVPIWFSLAEAGLHFFSALFSQHDNPVPVLWIPSSLPLWVCTQGSSTVVLACSNGHIVLLQLPARHNDDRDYRPMYYPSCTDERSGGATSDSLSAGDALHSRNQQHEVYRSQLTADENTVNRISKLTVKEPAEKQVKHVGRAITKRLKTAIVLFTDRITRRSKKRIP